VGISALCGEEKKKREKIDARGAIGQEEEKKNLLLGKRETSAQ